MTQLTGLELSHNSISDIRRLAGLTQLTDLELSHNNISDVRPLAGLTKLRRLELHHNSLSDIRPLAGLTKLTDLELSGNPILDTSPIYPLTQNRLTDVDIEVSTDVDIEVSLEPGVPRNEGQQPYTPSRLEWLALELNADDTIKIAVLAEGILVSYVTMPEENTIEVQISYPENTNPEKLQTIIHSSQRRAREKAKRYGWESWLIVKENLLEYQGTQT